jgi:hypothetical protein
MRFGLVVSVGCLALFLRGVDWVGIGRTLAEIDLVWLIPAVLSGGALYAVKAYRWRILLRPVATLGFWRLLRASFMGFMINSTLPARIGEFVRAAVVAMRGDVGVAPVFATIMVERIFDLFGIVFYFAAALVTLGLRSEAGRESVMPNWVWVGGGAITGVALLACLFLALLKFFPESIVRGCDRVARGCVALATTSARAMLTPFGGVWKREAVVWTERFGETADEKILQMLNAFVEGLQVVKGFWRTVWLGALSLAHWGFAILLIHFTAMCFPGIDLSLAGSALVFVFLALAVALPQAPGYLGTSQIAVEEACRALFTRAAYQAAVSSVKGYAMVLWCVNNIPVVAAGFVCLWIEGMTFQELRRRGEAAAREDGVSTEAASSVSPAVGSKATGTAGR